MANMAIPMVSLHASVSSGRASHTGPAVPPAVGTPTGDGVGTSRPAELRTYSA